MKIDSLGEGVAVGVVAFILVAFVAVFGGTVVYFIWPVAIPAAFPGLVAAGTLAAKLTWGQAIALTWLFSILLKSSSSATVKKN